MGNARSSAFRRDHSGLRNVVVSQQRGSGCWKAPYFDLEVPPPSVIVPHPIPDSVYRSKLREASDALSANYNATKGRITFFMVVGFTLPIIINIVPLVEGGGGYGITGGETRSIAFAVVGSIFIFTGIFMIVLRQRKIAKAMKDISCFFSRIKGCCLGLSRRNKSCSDRLAHARTIGYGPKNPCGTLSWPINSKK